MERLYRSRRRGRPRKSWIDDVTRHLATMGIRGKKGLAKDRRERRKIVAKAKVHQGL